ncbi:hypothetical protein AB0F88_30345 [Streptosporangium sp. NPDC023963]|uniref:hypothetical protein n=1 Tax=Streptosporangium sp. NPDC023963 TaxID=3155608 RepID=UPI003418D030
MAAAAPEQRRPLAELEADGTARRAESEMKILAMVHDGRILDALWAERVDGTDFAAIGGITGPIWKRFEIRFDVTYETAGRGIAEPPASVAWHLGWRRADGGRAPGVRGGGPSGADPDVLSRPDLLPGR